MGSCKYQYEAEDKNRTKEIKSDQFLYADIHKRLGLADAFLTLQYRSPPGGGRVFPNSRIPNVSSVRARETRCSSFVLRSCADRDPEIGISECGPTENMHRNALMDNSYGVQKFSTWHQMIRGRKTIWAFYLPGPVLI